MASPLQTASLAAAALGLVLAGTAMFLDWSGYDLEEPVTAGLWGWMFQGTSYDWDDEACQECNGFTVAMYVFPAGAAVLLAAVVLSGLSLPRPRLRMPAGIAGAAAGVVMAAGTVFHMSAALKDRGPEAADALYWGPGLFVAWGAVLLALVGGVALLVLSLRSPAPQGTVSATPVPRASAPGAATRRLTCPKCTAVVQVSAGQKPVCHACGFGA